MSRFSGQMAFFLDDGRRTLGIYHNELFFLNSVKYDELLIDIYRKIQVILSKNLESIKDIRKHLQGEFDAYHEIPKERRSTVIDLIAIRVVDMLLNKKNSKVYKDGYDFINLETTVQKDKRLGRFYY